MTDGFGVLLRRTVDANVRYYEAWGRLVGNYVRDLGAAASDFTPRIVLPTVKLPTVGTTATSVANATADRTAREPGAAPPAVVLEGPPGATAEGAVLVENHLAHPVSAAIHAEVDGHVELVVDPDRVDLAPGESAVVRVRTLIADAVDAPELRGQLLVPDLIGTAVPLVVRVRR